MNELVITKNKVSVWKGIGRYFDKAFSAPVHWQEKNKDVLAGARAVVLNRFKIEQATATLSVPLFRAFGMEEIAYIFRISEGEYLVVTQKWSEAPVVFKALIGDRIEKFLAGRKVLLGKREIIDLVNILPISLLHRFRRNAFAFGIRIFFSGDPAGFVMFSQKLSQKPWAFWEKIFIKKVMQYSFIGMEKSWLVHQLNEAKEKLKDASEKYKRGVENILRAQGEYFAGLSHEMKAPLAIIKHHLLLAEEEEKNVNTKAVSHQTQVLSRLVSDVLLLARLESKGCAPDKGWVSISEMLEEIHTDFEVLAEEKGITFANHTDKNVLAMADKVNLHRALINIVMNALAYTPRGGAVEMYARQTKDEVKIIILDTGIGMSANEQRSIFERFYRSEKAKKTSPEGSGLGLAISRRIVKEHGGHIELMSEEGKGTAVAIRLPAGVL